MANFLTVEDSLQLAAGSSTARIFLYYGMLKPILMTPIYGPFFDVCQGEKAHMGFALIFEAIANILSR